MVVSKFKLNTQSKQSVANSVGQQWWSTVANSAGQQCGQQSWSMETKSEWYDGNIKD